MPRAATAVTSRFSVPRSTAKLRSVKSFLFLLLLAASALGLTESELAHIGRKVWQNECGGTRDGLTSWNEGEDFASFGIGHFIWYPRGAEGPFEESFPPLLKFLETNGARVPGWLKTTPDCPWRTGAEFKANFRSDEMNALRDLLAATVPLQSRFLAQRLEQALPKMLGEAPAAQREGVRRQFARLMASSRGTFAMIDYVNFKGEGTKSSERYDGEGWGLLQVLLEMRGSGEGAAKEFGDAAAEVLTRRVRHSPPARGEARWLAGWKNRVRAYGGG